MASSTSSALGFRTPGLTAAAIGLAVLASYFLVGRNRDKTPPGPPGWPIVGNIFDMPSRESWKVYLEWSQKYKSDIIHMRVPGAQFFILNSYTAIQDLLVKRSHIYSDRPHSTFINDLIKVPWLIPFMNYTDEWKEHRRIFRKEFDNVEQSSHNKSHEVKAARRLLKRFLTSSDYHNEVRLAAVDAILSITYGITPTNTDHPFIKTPEKINAIFADVARGGYLVDVFPALKYLPSWLPGVKFHSVAKAGSLLAEELRMGPFREVKKQVESGVAKSSVASRFLYAVQEGAYTSPKEIEEMTNVLGNAYLGGADTTVCGLQNFVLAMSLYPRVQEKAQAALDAIVLREHRLPTFDDQASLPYITAIVLEVLRWHPVTPFAIYHLAGAEAGPYRGYRIPKGAMLVPNLWGLMRDEDLFGPETERFIPERFMEKAGNGNGEKLKADLSNAELSFGFGRRTCPGKLMARDTIWIMVAHILAAYNISNPVDADGKPLTADDHLEYTNAMVSFPPHVKVTITPRIPESIIHDSLSSDE